MLIVIIIIVVLVVAIVGLLAYCFICGPCKRDKSRQAVQPLSQPANSQPRATPELCDPDSRQPKGMAQLPQHSDSNINLATVHVDENEFTEPNRKEDDIEKRLKQKK